MEKNKLVLPISIILGCIILGGFYYASEVNKQQSVERQQQLDLQAKQTELQTQSNTEEQKKIDLAACLNKAELIYKHMNEFLFQKGKEPDCENTIGCPKAVNVVLEEQKKNLQNDKDECFKLFSK